MELKYTVMWGTRMDGKVEAEFHSMQLEREGYELVCQVYVPGGPAPDEVGAMEAMPVEPQEMVYKNIYRKVR
jgi:hypothetical protein